MELNFVLLCTMLADSVMTVSAAAQPGIIETLLLSIEKRPWLMGVYVFTVGLPIILFISFMWPDKRFGPPDQPYYYKKSDDVQPDDAESFLDRDSVNTKGLPTRVGEATVTHKRSLNKRNTTKC